MKELLTVTENRVIPSAYAVSIPEFKVLKPNELAFVYFYTDHNSPYAAYSDEDRLDKLNIDLKTKANPKVLGAITKYKELSETSAVKLLKAARSSVTKLVNGLQELEDIVKKQQQKENPNRGGVKTNKYSS